MTEKRNFVRIETEFARCWAPSFNDCIHGEVVGSECRFLSEDMYCISTKAVIEAVKAGLKDD
jgi:hypothetical protein